ncbi:MAG: hypothetical protein HOA90_17875, partial [Prolixibacteraceae bacterium]|nr:hypothetical protein [Prolixibacteraceae bacterium]
VEGAYLNVKINAAGFDDKKYLIKTLNKAGSLAGSAKEKEKLILEIVHGKIGD